MPHLVIPLGRQSRKESWDSVYRGKEIFWNQGGRIDNGGQPEPGHQNDVQDISKVPEKDVDRTEKKGHTKDKDGLKEDDQRQREIGPLGKISVDKEDWKNKNEGNEKVQKTGEDNRKGKNLPGKIDRFDEVTTVR